MNGKNLNHSKIMVVFAVDRREVLFVYIQPNIIKTKGECENEKR